MKISRIGQNFKGVYQSVYPPEYSTTYVKSTSRYSTIYYAHFACDPSNSLTGSRGSNSWLADNGVNTNQRFHIDLGSAYIISRIYYENAHNSGSETDSGVKNFTFWGSNSATSFAEVTYSIDTGWTQIPLETTAFIQHVGTDVVDPHYIVINPPGVGYRYYAFKFANNYGDALMGIRRIELQILT